MTAPRDETPPPSERMRKLVSAVTASASLVMAANKDAECVELVKEWSEARRALLAAIAELESELSGLRASLARAEADTRRLDWLISQHGTLTFGQFPYAPSLGLGIALYMASDHRGAIDMASGAASPDGERAG